MYSCHACNVIIRIAENRTHIFDGEEEPRPKRVRHLRAHFENWCVSVWHHDIIRHRTDTGWLTVAHVCVDFLFNSIQTRRTMTMMTTTKENAAGVAFVTMTHDPVRFVRVVRQ